MWHGYLLRGSGSNIYTANIARGWRHDGHAVVVMCQDAAAVDESWVDDDVDLSTQSLPRLDRGPGSCTIVRPDIGGLLPVYVYDDYEGFEVKRFVDLSDDELDEYTRRNVDAMVDVITAFRPDAIITGHEVMGPYIAKLACAATGTSFVTKLHGSALEYAVREQERYLHYATEGLSAARRVVGGSNYMVEAAARVIPGWHDRASVVNPGCDTSLFHPAPAGPTGPPTIAYVGKLIIQKGVHNMLAALGLTTTRDLRVEVIGFGGFESELRRLAAALATGDRAATVAAARTGGLDDVATFLETAAPSVWARYAEVPVNFVGRLDHEPLAQVLPGFDLLVVPSVLPEAFGMVAAEAAACAVLPVVPDHSGICEAGAAIEQHLATPGLLTFPSAGPITGIASAVERVLAIDRVERRRLGLAAAELAMQRWSWTNVARSLLTATGN